MLASCIILTLASVVAGLTEEALRTLFVTAWSCVTCLTMALPSHRVTASRTTPALTQVGTVLPPASRLTRFPAVGSCPAILTNTETRHMMAMTVVFTGTVQLASKAKVSSWANILTEISHVSRETNTGSILSVTHSTIVTFKTQLSTSQTPMALFTIFLTVFSHLTGGTVALSGYRVTWGFITAT